MLYVVAVEIQMVKILNGAILILLEELFRKKRIILIYMLRKLEMPLSVRYPIIENNCTHSCAIFKLCKIFLLYMVRVKKYMV